MFKSLFVTALLAVSTLGAHAEPVTITTPFINFENVAINSLGFGTGQFLRFGANATTANGPAGTTGVPTLNGSSLRANIPFTPSPLAPNRFVRDLSIAPQQTLPGSSLFNPWTLTFTNTTNTTNTAQAVVQMQSGAQLVPFVNSITLSGTSANPTFSWTPPASIAVDGYRVNIYDKALINLNPINGPVSTGQVTSANLQPNITSYTVQPGEFTNPGNSFALNKNYSIEISLLQTRDRASERGRQPRPRGRYRF